MLLQSYPFYVSDWRTSQDVIALTAEARDVYRNLFDICWMDGDLPTDERVLQRLSMADAREWRRSWPSVRPLFQEIDGRLHLPKIDERRPELVRWHESKREAGKLGGRAKAQLQHSHKQKPSTATGSALAQLKPSASIVVNTPLPPLENLDANQAISDMLALHPKKDGRIMAEQALSAILGESIDPVAVLADIQRRHAAKCRCEDWMRDGGRYAPKLHNWLSRGEYLDGDISPADPDREVVTVPDCAICDKLGYVYLDPKDKNRGMIQCECRKVARAS